MSLEDSIDRVAALGYNIALDGPDTTKITPAYRWTLRGYTNERDSYNHPVGREMFHGETPGDVLAQMLTWIHERGGGQ